jgi:ABC-2 type transport system permease protein
VVVTTLVVTLAMVPFSLDEAGFGPVIAATAACGALAALHGSVGYAVAGLGGPRGVAIGSSVGVLLIGYVMAFVLPLSDTLDGARAWSPWHWAIGQQPVSDGVGLGLVAVLAVTAEWRPRRVREVRGRSGCVHPRCRCPG